jgi:hypothetical protein
MSITGAASHLDLQDNAAQRSMLMASELVAKAANRNMSGADLFAAFAAMVGAQNPRLARLTLSALEAAVMLGQLQTPGSLAAAIVDASAAPIERSDVVHSYDARLPLTWP